jgi:circadian clock protein KaiB
MTFPTASDIFKGIALFTPGGDLVYCLDRNKRDRWHLQLCIALQELLGLPEPPHFLVPAYTATIDRWCPPNSGEIKTFAELYPAVQRYQPLLDVIFEIDEIDWQVAVWQEETCNPVIIESYRDRFPQLWESHDLIACLNEGESLESDRAEQSLDVTTDSILLEEIQNYVLHLFVMGNDVSTKRTLETLHQVLEQELQHPYTLKVIDILKHPKLAEVDRVSATPTLVRVSPLPVRRIVGELDDMQRVIQIVRAG